MRLCTHLHHRCSTLDVLDNYNVIITIISSLKSIHKKTMSYYWNASSSRITISTSAHCRIPINKCRTHTAQKYSDDEDDEQDDGDEEDDDDEEEEGALRVVNQPSSCSISTPYDNGGIHTFFADVWDNNNKYRSSWPFNIYHQAHTYHALCCNHHHWLIVPIHQQGYASYACFAWNKSLLLFRQNFVEVAKREVFGPPLAQILSQDDLDRDLLEHRAHAALV